MDEGIEGAKGTSEGEAALKARRALKALSLSRAGTMGELLNGQPGARQYPACLYLFT